MKYLLFITLFFLNYSLAGQHRIMELLLENSSQDPQETDLEMIHSILEDLELHPLNINQASKNELAESKLFNDFQIHMLLQYREKYGHFLSIYELQSIPGFHKEYLQNLESYISLQQEIKAYRRSKGMLLSTSSIRLPYTSAYTSNSNENNYYVGHPVKFNSRLKYQFESGLTAGLCIEKDPGELLFSHGKIEHLSAYFQIENKKLADRLIIGNYRLHNGSGLVNGFGLNSSWETMISSYHLAQAKAFSSTMEYDYYRGIYWGKSFGNWSFNLNYSFKQNDLSFHNWEAKDDLFDAVRRTGYHRTYNEIGGQKLSDHHSYGASITHSSEYYHGGFHYQSAQLFLNKAGRDSVPNGNLSKSAHTNFSYSQIISLKAFNHLTEIAVNSSSRFALFSSGTYQINPAISIAASFRYFQDGYSGQYPIVYASSSQPSNESGFSMSTLIIPINNVRIKLFYDAHKSLLSNSLPSNKYTGRNRILLSYDANKSFALILQLTTKNMGTTANEAKQNISLRYNYSLLENLKLQGRIERHYFLQRKHTQPAQMIYQQFQYLFRKDLNILYRIAYFQVSNWETRIYSYEPGLKYSFLFPAWYGEGIQNLLCITYKTKHKMILRFKYVQTHYSHQHETGSFPETSIGDIKHQLEFQLEYKL